MSEVDRWRYLELQEERDNLLYQDEPDDWAIRIIESEMMDLEDDL